MIQKVCYCDDHGICQPCSERDIELNERIRQTCLTLGLIGLYLNVAFYEDLLRRCKQIGYNCNCDAWRSPCGCGLGISGIIEEFL